MGEPEKEKERISMKAKKVLAMLMASAMIMGTTVTAFAAPGNVPSTEDKKMSMEIFQVLKKEPQ